MATNTATANVKGGLFGDSAGLTQLASISGKNGRRSDAAKQLGTRTNYALRQIMYVTAGAAPGATATYTYPLINASTSELGGKRVVVQTSLVNRATTAADVTEYKNDILRWSTRTTFGANPVPNKDGNPLGTW
jgi:hypothetical protein